MITEQMIPMIIVPTTFLFVLLIILVAKAPKAGAWVVGSLVLLAPVLLWRLAAAGALAHAEAIPVIVVPATFLFVLMIVLLAKVPKVGAGLIIALVVMGLFALLAAPTLSRQLSGHGHAMGTVAAPRAEVAMVSHAGDSVSIEATAKEFDKVFEAYAQEPPSAAEPAVAPVPSQPVTPVVASPIWAEGIEQELEADIYPSKPAAVRAAGPQLSKSIRQLAPDANSPLHVVVFQEPHDYQLIAGLREAIRRAMPDVSCDVEAELRAVKPNEVGVALYLGDLDVRSAPWAKSGETTVAGGQLNLNLSGRGGKVSVPIRFSEKPWVESFASFANARPDQHFIVARSNGTCTSEGEANQQVLDDARARIAELLSRNARRGTAILPRPEVAVTDVLQGGFIIDRFAQSFEGSAGKIWRQAMLIDVSGAKLAQLFNQKTHESRQMRMSWARMGFSVIGVTVLIGAIYFFLNMATRGYYEWSLRIAGVVLAIVAVISILMVVK